MLRKTIINGRIQFVLEKPLINNIISKKIYTPYVPPQITEIIEQKQRFNIYAVQPKEIFVQNQSNIPQPKEIIEKKPLFNIYSHQPEYELTQHSHLKPNITIEPTFNIPFNLFQTWHTLDLPHYMNTTTETLKSENPEFNYYLYDDKMCRDFIQSYYDDDTLYAFDSLIPGAFKADLWRYCVLYVYGGVYLDIKYKSVDGFKLSSLMNKEYFVRDYYDGIYQAFLICLPKNEILMNCIHQIILNAKSKSYTLNALSITGPQLMNKYFTLKQINNLELKLSMPYIILNNDKILQIYDEYKYEQERNQLTLHYSIMWKNKKVYK